MSNEELKDVELLLEADFKAIRSQPENDASDPGFGMLVDCTTIDGQGEEHTRRIVFPLQMCSKLLPVLQQFIRRLSVFDEHGLPGQN